MPAITIKNIPSELYEEIKASASNNMRSINNEIIFRLNIALKRPKIKPDNLTRRIDELNAKLSLPELTDEFLHDAKKYGSRMIVVDTNVIAYLFIKGEKTSHAKFLLRYDPDWIAPVLWKSEFRNILALYIRKNLLSYENSLLLLKEAEQFMKDKEFEVRSIDVMKLVSESGCSAYDCEFVALANSLNLKLYTSDKKLITEFPHSVVSLAKI